MTEAAPTEDRAAARAATAGPGWRVREAGADDVAAFAAAVEALLDELGGRKPSPEELRGEVEALLAAREAGSLLVAEAEWEEMLLKAAAPARALAPDSRPAAAQAVPLRV